MWRAGLGERTGRSGLMTEPRDSRVPRPGRLVVEAILLIAALASGVAAAWMTAHRHEGYDVLCVKEADLYQLADKPWISGFGFEPDGRLTIEIENLAETRWARLEGDVASEWIEGANPVIKLEPGITKTRLRGESTGQALEFRIQWIPGHAEPLVTQQSLRMGQRPPYSTGDFVIPPDAYSREHLEEARRILAPLALESRPELIDRVASLAAFLHDQLEPHRGVPSKRMGRLNGFEQYREAMAGRDEVYCSNHAEIYAFFANAVGLPTRLVDVAGRVGDVAVGAHSFVETYLEDENRWVFVDLQMGLAGVEDGDGVFLNAAQLVARIRAGTTASLVTHVIQDGQVLREAWGPREDLRETFLTPTASLVFLSSSPDRFAFLERLKRLLVTPRPAICAGNAVGAERRIAATGLAVACGTLWLALRVRSWMGTRGRS